MPIFVIWVDREQTRIVQFSGEKMERRTVLPVRSQMNPISIHVKDYFLDIVGEIMDAQRLLISGPGVAKHHFFTFLQEHFPALAKKVLGCVTMNEPTDSEIASLAKGYLGIPTKKNPTS